MKMKKWKKVTAGALSVCMLASCTPYLSEAVGVAQTTITALAETDGTKVNDISGTCGTNVTYSYNSKTKTLTLSGSGSMNNGEFYFDEDTDSDIYINCFPEDHDNIILHEMQTLIVGDKITRIGTSAFSQCEALKTVKLGKNTNAIGGYAFAGCTALETIQSGNHIKSIEKRAFSECFNLNKLSAFPNLAKIGSYSFYGCKKLKTFSIGKQVKSIGTGAFSECENLKKLSVDKGNIHFSSQDNMLLNKNQSNLVSACFGSNKTCSIYGSVKTIDKAILEDTSIKSFAVSKKNLKYTAKNGILYSKNKKKLIKCPSKISGVVNVDNHVTTIATGAFGICNNVTQINFGEHVTSISSLPFITAPKLKKIQISDKNKNFYEIDGSVISKVDDELIYCYKIHGDTYTIPDSVKKIGDWAFRTQYNLKNLILPNHVATDYNTFGKDTYTGLNIETISLGNNYSDSTNSFNEFSGLYHLKAITVSNKNPNYTSNDGILYTKDGKELLFLPYATEAYTIPEGVTGVNLTGASFLFLKKLTISDHITDATDWLRTCSALNTLHLGKNLNTLINSEFREQFKLTYHDNYVRSFPELKYISVSEENSTFKSVNNMLYSKDGSKFIWCPAQTEGKVILEPGVTEISESAFSKCTKITDIVFPDTISKIDDCAFGYQQLEHTVPNGYSYPTENPITIWVPKGKLDYYKSLFTPKTGFKDNMVIKELEN